MKKLDVAIVRDPFTTWNPESTDLKKLWHISRRPRSQYFVLSCTEIAPLPPDTDTKCVFYMPANFQDRPLPEQGIDEADVEDMITELTENMNEAFIDVVKIDRSKGYDIAVGRRIN